VIPRPDGVEAEPVDERDGVAQLRPGGVLGREVDAPVRSLGRDYPSFPVAA
jgi:hypothetical protein